MNIFPIAPAESRYLWFLIPVIVILLGAIGAGRYVGTWRSLLEL